MADVQSVIHQVGHSNPSKIKYFGLLSQMSHHHKFENLPLKTSSLTYKLYICPKLVYG